jgi:hypothetical protein
MKQTTVALGVLSAICVLIGAPTAAGAQRICGGGINCYICVNTGPTTQDCALDWDGWGDCCDVQEWPVGSGEWWCNTSGDPCQPFETLALAITPAGTVVTSHARVRFDGVIVSKCGGYVVSHQPFGDRLRAIGSAAQVAPVRASALLANVPVPERLVPPEGKLEIRA